MRIEPNSRATSVLVLWYGLFQAAHLLLNAAYLLDPGEPPFHPPPEGWQSQTVAFLNGMAVADALNAMLSLAFVWSYLRRRPSCAWLGTLTLTVSVYAGFVFVWGAVASGARGLGVPYLWVNLPFLPVLALFGLWCVWGATGRLRELMTD